MAVVSTTGPEVVHRLDEGPRAGLPVVTSVPAAGERSLTDAVLLAVRQLPTVAGRQQHVVIVAAGADESSSAEWAAAGSLAARRGVLVDVIDLSRTGALPAAEQQCPGPVAAEDATAAGTSIGERIADRRRLLLPEVDDESTDHDDGLGRRERASALVGRRTDITEPQPSAGPRGGFAPVGVGTLLLSFLVGLIGLGALLLGVTARSPRTVTLRRATGDLVRAARDSVAERDAPDVARRVPRAEARRRLTDARQDLVAALGAGPTARMLAEDAARAEQTVLLAEAQHEQAVRERVAARARAAERQYRSLRRAELLAAQNRALLQTAELHRTARQAASGAESDAENARSSAIAEASWLLAAERAAEEEAKERRLAAELAATEAAERARREQEAAAAAERERAEAERAAERAHELAELEQQLADDAAAARRMAEATASAIDLRDAVTTTDVRVGGVGAAAVPALSQATRVTAWVDAPVSPSVLRRGTSGEGVGGPGPDGQDRSRRGSEDPDLDDGGRQDPSLGDPPGIPSRRVAWGAPLVRLTATSYTTQVRVASVTAALLEHRNGRVRPDPAALEAKIARFSLIALVPLVVVGRAALDPGWLESALTSGSTAVLLVAAVALAAFGSWWTWRVTTPPYGLRRQPADPGRIAAARGRGTARSPAGHRLGAELGAARNGLPACRRPGPPKT